MAKKYWLVKSEPEDYSIEDFRRDDRTGWTGVRNFQARNFMRDEMKRGDGVLFYHSNADPPAIVGIAEVCRENLPDPTQFDTKSDYHDPRAKTNAPVWMMVELKFVAAFQKPLALPELKKTRGLEKMLLLQRGSRLSVQPVSAAEWGIIVARGRKG